MRTLYKIYASALCTLLYGTAYTQQYDADTALGGRSNRLEEVTVKANVIKAAKAVEETQMGRIELPVSMMKRVPALGGEPDIIKALQLTPGVKRGAEGTIGMYVRGGGNDENLILLDDATVYNAGHLLGFFSIFNTATLKDVQLYKSSFPTKFGGRLSSVLDVKTKEASLTDFKASGSIGLISSSLSVQAPIIKNKLSVMLSGRRTYIDKIYTYVPYHFYDINSKITYVVNANNRLYLSYYQGDDVLKFDESNPNADTSVLHVQSAMKLGNRVGTLRWNHMFKENKYGSDLSVSYSGFRYSIFGKAGTNMLTVHSAIRDIAVRGDIKTYAEQKHKLSSGFSVINHFFQPNVMANEGELVAILGNSKGKEIYNTEVGVYANDEVTIGSRWLLNMGMRVSGDIMPGRTYVSAEPRTALRYKVDDRSSVKASYARMTQYMHLVSSASLALPTDLWYPVTPNIKPGTSDQVSLGYYYNIANTGINLSAEVYYKKLNNLVEYREGALLIMNNDYEKELVHGKGRSYGLELFAGKTSGKFTGWLGYSLSYAHRTFDSLNRGKEYFARYDRRHDFSFVGIYDLGKHWGFSGTVVYATGTPFTGQVNQYVSPKPDLSGFEILPAYTERNKLRMSPSFRIDLDVQYKFSIGKKLQAEAHASVYNLLNRAQPYTVRRVYSNGNYKYQQPGLFGAIPTVSLNFNF